MAERVAFPGAAAGQASSAGCEAARGEPGAPAGGSAPYPPRRIYAVVGVPPEVQAYAMAKYSRSSQGMLESIQELSAQKAEQFLDTFYFQYGHRSIADLAHLVFGLEQVSLLAAIDIVDEQLWDGQERSTRYQPFRTTGWYFPPELAGSGAEPVYRQTAEALFTAYEEVSGRLLELLVAAIPRPGSMSAAAHRRTLRARAFDVARALLPLATHTSVGQVVSARVLERQIARLLASPYPELRQIAGELKRACVQPAEAPLLGRLPAGAADEELLALLRPKVAPTLVKYATASPYREATARELAEAACVYLSPVGEPDRARPVELVEPAPDPLHEIVATLLYRHDAAGHSYRQALEAVAGLSDSQRRDVLGLSLRHRGPHDELLREHQAGYGLAFDVLMDLGSFRDLHRHRRTVQVRQPYTPAHGFERPEETFQAGLGASVALAALEEGLGETFAETLAKAEQAARLVRTIDPLAADYLLPLAYRVRCLFKMDWAQAAYLVELRTGSAGHFSYRRIAWLMKEALQARYPALAEPIRASNPDEHMDLLQR